MSDVPPPGWGGPPPPPGQQPHGSGPYPADSGRQPPPPYAYGQQPPPYGYQAYNPMGGGPQVVHPQGTTILVLGIVGLVLTFVCGIGALLGPFAWVMGTKALREIDSNPSVSYTNRGSVTAGRVCGIITTVLLAIGLLAVLIAIIVTASTN